MERELYINQLFAQMINNESGQIFTETLIITFFDGKWAFKNILDLLN